MADLIWADGCGEVYFIPCASLAPTIVKGKNPLALPYDLAPNNSKGSVILPIGLDRKLASPVKVALIGLVDIAPIISRTPVPALPQSMISSGSENPPTPTPFTDQFPSPWSMTLAPKAVIARAVSNTSCPNNSPDILVSPTDNAPNISDL